LGPSDHRAREISGLGTCPIPDDSACGHLIMRDTADQRRRPSRAMLHATSASSASLGRAPRRPSGKASKPVTTRAEWGKSGGPGRLWRRSQTGGANGLRFFSRRPGLCPAVTFKRTIFRAMPLRSSNCLPRPSWPLAPLASSSHRRGPLQGWRTRRGVTGGVVSDSSCC
jgi:hypothetical protein